MNPASKTKRYILGLSIGTFWLIASSAGFSIQMITTVGTSKGRTALAAVIVAAAALLAVSLRQVVAATKLPNEPPAPGPRSIRRRFVWIVILEVAGIMLVNAAFYFTGHMSLLVPFDLIIVGIHFFPLGTLFGVRRYTLLGAAFCAIPLLTVLLIPAESTIGAALTRFLIPTLGCTAATWLTAIGSMVEIQRLLSGTEG